MLWKNVGAGVSPEMFTIGRWSEPTLQQIFDAQFGSGTTPGGHVTSFLVESVLKNVDDLFVYFHTHLPHSSVCVSETL